MVHFRSAVESLMGTGVVLIPAVALDVAGHGGRGHWGPVRVALPTRRGESAPIWRELEPADHAFDRERAPMRCLPSFYLEKGLLVHLSRKPK